MLAVGWDVKANLATLPIEHMRNWKGPFRMVLYPLTHASWEHLFNNFSSILLLGPILEARFGSRRLALMLLTTTVLTSAANAIVSESTGIAGASGLVFMMTALLGSVGGRKGDDGINEVPVTFVLLATFLGCRELAAVFNEDHISRFGHICGGAIGCVMAWLEWGGRGVGANPWRRPDESAAGANSSAAPAAAGGAADAGTAGLTGPMHYGPFDAQCGVPAQRPKPPDRRD